MCVYVCVCMLVIRYINRNVLQRRYAAAAAAA